MEQNLLNWIFIGFGAVVSWIAKIIWGTVKDLERKIAETQQSIPETYVRRDDFKDAVKDMRDGMREGFKHVEQRLDVLFQKLDQKEDRN
ncbi:MAG: hypothetical protein JSV82_00865 [Planctomycetota bacterium]|jgi:cell division protein FtsB|nr:MAG: hypothetical protein JSV82_00865 [Planctomycetota bacterium]